MEADHLSDTTLICGKYQFDMTYTIGESFSNVLYVEFYSDYELASSGFELTFEFSEGTCILVHLNAHINRFHQGAT